MTLIDLFQKLKHGSAYPLGKKDTHNSQDALRLRGGCISSRGIDGTTKKRRRRGRGSGAGGGCGGGGCGGGGG
uniref:Uncharacterized protein n=1 Tax=Kwoniella dejecticola CBS 10117 TaxID=1296121 RepID=A0A1A6A390_9TREE|nr:uncharacterized protein I303_05387 [Kwoniella dejecticola CBS 10117]OBR84528.1 hypothetical protein I303_05387 [Kwoniella dejecticola CBS 10117]